MKVILNIFLFLFFFINAYSQTKKQDPFFFSLSGGLSFLEGEYKSKLEYGKSVNFSILYLFPRFNPYIDKFVLGETEFLYRKFDLSNSEESSFKNYLFRTGIIAKYPFHSLFQPYLGVSVQTGSFSMEAKQLEEKQNSIKNGVIYKSGFFSNFKNGTGLRFSVDYERDKFSKSLFECFTYSTAVTFNYLKYKRNTERNKFNPEILYFKGKEFFRSRKMYKAEKMFKKFIQYKSDDEKTKNYLLKIEENDKIFKEGDYFYRREKYFEAIPYFKKSSKFYYLAEVNLKIIRKKLKSKIPSLLKNGTISFNNKKYKKTIYYMNRVLLINPKNKKGFSKFN